MSDDLENRGGQDRNRIDVNEDWELRYWSEKLGCTPDQLKAAVKAVGTSVKDVEAHIGKAKGQV